MDHLECPTNSKKVLQLDEVNDAKASIGLRSVPSVYFIKRGKRVS
jgi:hypothetical protein